MKKSLIKISNEKNGTILELPYCPVCWDKSAKHVKSWGRSLEIPPVDIRRISGTGLNDIQRIFAGYPPAGFTKFGPSDKIY